MDTSKKNELQEDESISDNMADKEVVAKRMNPPPERARNPLQKVPVPLETALRMTTAAFLGYSLAYAGDTSVKAIPTSQAWLIGLFASIITMRLPTNITLVLGGVGLMYMILILGLAFSTTLLSAATVSDGLFVTMMALWALWISGLRFGPTQKLTGIVTSVMAAIVGMVTLGLFVVVRDGVEVSVRRELWTDVVGGYANQTLQMSSSAKEYLMQLVQASVIERRNGTSSSATEELVGFLQQIDLPQISLGGVLELAEGSLDRVQEYSEEVHQGIQLLAEVLSDDGLCIPREDGLFYGRSFCFGLDEEMELHISADGGMWLIKRLWTWTGVDNPLAVFQNLLIVGSWSLLCVFSAALLPPWRSLRYDLTRIELPLTLRDAAWYMKRRCETPGRSMTEDEEKVRHRLVDASSTYHNGLVALVTAFEPRLLDNPFKAPRCTWSTLKELVSSVEYVALNALALGYQPLASIKSEEMGITTQSLEDLAAALENQDKPGSSGPTTSSKQRDDVEKDPLRLTEVTDRVEGALEAWFEDLRPTKNGNVTCSQGSRNFLKTVAFWFAPCAVFLAQLASIPLLPLLWWKGFYQWDTSKVFHCIKFAAGFTAFVCCSVYWGDYREHEVSLGQSSDPGYSLAKGTKLSSFAGWHLFAYVFATMPTAEGTVKKCTLRLVGTCVGAFSAWALIHATGDNEFGSVAWLTITTFPAVYMSVENRPGLRQRARSEDFGYGGFYFVLTQSVIMMDYTAGLGDRDDLVVNRLVSNVSGILMAMLLAVIPPTVMGGDTKWAFQILDEIVQTFEAMNELIKNGKFEELEKLRTSFSKRVDTLHSDTVYLLEDAKRLSIFPLYQVDPVLDKEVSDLAVTSAMMNILIDRTGILAKTHTNDLATLQKELEDAFSAGARNKASDVEESEPDAHSFSQNETEVLVSGIRAMYKKIEDHKEALGGDSWGVQVRSRQTTPPEDTDVSEGVPH